MEMPYLLTMTLIQFHPPADNIRGPAYLEPLIEGWVGLVGKEGIRLGIRSDHGTIAFLIDAPEQRQRVIAAQLANAFPGGKADTIADAVLNPKHQHSTTAWLRLTPDVYPLKLHHAFVEQHSREAFDALEGLLEVIKSGRSGRLMTTVWLKLKPRKKSQVERAERNSRLLASSFPLRVAKDSFERNFSGSAFSQRMKLWLLRRIVRGTRAVPEEVADKLKQHLFAASIRVEVSTDQPNEGLHQQRIFHIKSALCLLTEFSAIFFVEMNPRGSFLLTAPEIATLWHIPTVENKVPRVEKQSFRELEPPSNLPRPGDSPDIVTLGRVCFRNERYKFGMDLEARRRHLWVLGKTGMGKTTLLQNIIAEDLAAGRGLAIIEPHGDLAENTLRFVPKRRKNDIVYFDAADPNSKVTFNPLLVPNGSDKTLVADGVLSAFQKVFGMDEAQAPRLLHIFRNCLLSLVEMPNATLIDVQRILIEPVFRKSVIARVTNPVVRSFWLDEFGKWKPNDRTAFIASLQNKLGAFLTNEKLQRVLGDPKAKLDLRRIMDDGKVLIVNLSKGRLGENASNLLGTLLVTSLQLAAMSRANVPESDRRDFSIVIDEFQNFATPSITTFLSEARKYRTHLILANQYTEQLPPETFAAVLGNVGNQIVFQLGATDAELFEKQFGQSVTADNLMNIPKYQAFCRTLLNGMPSRLFSINSIPR
jgi:hypothetical protein